MSLIGAGALESRLTAIGNTRNMMGRLALTVLAEQKRQLYPGHGRRTGNLSRTGHIEGVTATSASVVFSANYAGAVNYGTRPHDIVPRTRKALRWPASPGAARLTGSPRTGGSVRFAKRVRHPGTKGLHYAEAGARNALGKEHLADVVIAEWNAAG